MTDADVQRELDENARRAEQTERDGEQSLDRTVDGVLSPITNLVHRMADDGPAEHDVENQREANDADQRPD